MPAFMCTYAGNTINGVMSGLDLGSNSCYQPRTPPPPTFCHSHSFLKYNFSIHSCPHVVTETVFF